MNEEAKQMENKEKQQSQRKRGRESGIAAAILVLLVATLWFWHDQYKYESTDDAYIQADATQLAPEVSGIITRVLVDENQTVKAGQILVQIDQRDYRAAYLNAQGELDALVAQLRDAKSDFIRSQKLYKGRAISPQVFEHAKFAYEDLDRKVRASTAKLDQAKLNLEYTSVRAPSDGQIARKAAQVGMFAATGTALLGFVPMNERWVNANFKETQLEFVAPGRPAKVSVDALSGRTFDAVVESVSPATGSTFTLLPPDNATGNFTKVTQRVPVRIRLKNLTRHDIELLQAGLSADVDLLKREPLEALPAPAPPVFVTGQE